MVPESWKEVTLSEVCGKPISYGIVQTGELVKDGVPCVRVVDLTKKEILVEEMITTSEEVNCAYQKTILEKDEIMIALRGEVGLARIVETNLVGSNLTRGIARISPKRDLTDPVFLLWAIRSASFRADLMRRVGGSALQEIALGELRKVKTPIPPLPEQEKIARILLTWERAIEVTEKLISNSQGQQKSLTQQLLTGKKRLEGFKKNNGVIKTRYGLIPDDWDFVSIESIAEQFVKKNSDENDYPVLSCSKYVGFVDSLKYFKKKVYSDNTSGYKIIERGCFGFPSNHIEEGSIGYQNLYEAGLVSPIYTVFKANNKLVNDLFLYKLLKTEHYRQIFAAATNASVDRRGSLRWKEFGKIKIMLPSLKEQKKIALVLSTADKEIETLQQKLEFIKQEKKALMQQLLTGKRRVKIDEDSVTRKEVVRA